MVEEARLILLAQLKVVTRPLKNVFLGREPFFEDLSIHGVGPRKKLA